MVWNRLQAGEDSIRKTTGLSYYSMDVLSFFNSLPNNNISDLPELKALADDNFRVVQMMQFSSDRVENTVGKGENAGYQHFLLFLQCFQKASF